MPPLQPQHTPPSTPQTVAIEMLLWARADLLEARTDQEIAYCRRVIERREAAYRQAMGHPAPVGGLRHKPNGEYK